MAKRRITAFSLPAWLGGGGLSWENIEEKLQPHLSDRAVSLLKEILGPDSNDFLKSLAAKPTKLRGLTIWRWQEGDGRWNGSYEPIFNSPRRDFDPKGMGVDEFAEMQVAVEELVEAGLLRERNGDEFREVYTLSLRVRED
jgi:hypothetical protein